MSVIQDVLQTGAADIADVAFALDVSPRSVERWAAAGVNPARRETLGRLLELKAVTDLAVRVMAGGSAALWLRSPVPALDYSKPLELIRDGEFRRVISALEALGEGICT